MELIVRIVNFRACKKRVDCDVVSGRKRRLIISSSRMPLVGRSVATSKGFRLVCRGRKGKFAIPGGRFSFRFASIVLGKVEVFEGDQCIFEIHGWSFRNLSGYDNVCKVRYKSVPSADPIGTYEFKLRDLSSQDFIHRDQRIESVSEIAGYPIQMFEMFFSWLVANRLYT